MVKAQASGGYPSRILVGVWNEFVYGGHLLSLGASGIVWTVSILLQKNFSLALFLIPYFLSQIIYTYNYLKESQEDEITKPDRSNYFEVNKNRTNFLLMLYSLLLLLVLSFSNSKVFIFCLSFVLFGLLYTLYFKRMTKNIPTFKNLYIGFFWGILVFIPPLYFEISITTFLILTLLIFFFLRSFINSAFFDIFDVDEDKREGLKTMPVLFTSEETTLLLNLLNLVSILPVIFFYLLNYFDMSVLILFVPFFYTFLYLNALKLKFRLSETSVRLMADAEDVFMIAIVLLFNFYLI